MKRCLLLLCCGLTWVASYASADSPALSDAFSAGTNFGRANNPNAKAQINADGAAQVPGAASAPAQSAYFGSPGLGNAAAAQIEACAQGANNPSANQDPACAAVNFTQTNPGARVQFTPSASDPLLTGARTILNDPAAIAGNLAGTYSGCTAQTLRSPDIFETQLCHEYRTLEHHVCEKTLDVTVVDQGLSCNLGDRLTGSARVLFIRPATFVVPLCGEDIRFQWFYTYSECTGTPDLIYSSSVMASEASERTIVALGCGGTFYISGACPDGNCVYQVGLPDANLVCDQPCEDGCCGYRSEDYPLANFSFQRPTHRYTSTDAWNNQCTVFEARLP